MEPWEILNYAMNKIDKVFEEAKPMAKPEDPAIKALERCRQVLDEIWLDPDVREENHLWVQDQKEAIAMADAALAANQAKLAAYEQMEKALRVIQVAINDGDGGPYWPAREYLDKHDIYNGDLNDLRVLGAVCEVALSAALAARKR